MLVVAPRIVTASPMSGMKRANKQLMVTIMKVDKTFCLVFNLYPAGKNISSIVSLQGKIVKGVANKTTKQIPNKQIYMSGLS